MPLRAKAFFAEYDNAILNEGRDVQTVRSFCRVCTEECGILVEVSGDEFLSGGRCPMPGGGWRHG